MFEQSGDIKIFFALIEWYIVGCLAYQSRNVYFQHSFVDLFISLGYLQATINQVLLLKSAIPIERKLEGKPFEINAEINSISAYPEPSQ